MSLPVWKVSPSRCKLAIRACKMETFHNEEEGHVIFGAITFTGDCFKSGNLINLF